MFVNIVFGFSLFGAALVFGALFSGHFSKAKGDSTPLSTAEWIVYSSFLAGAVVTVLCLLLLFVATVDDFTGHNAILALIALVVAVFEKHKFSSIPSEPAT